MQTGRNENALYPFAAIASSVLVLIGSLLLASKNGFLFLAAVLLLFLVFKMGKYFLRILPAAVILGGIYFLVCYLITSSLKDSIAGASRIVGVCMAIVPGMSIPPVNLTRALNEMKAPRSISLGILITLRFFSLLAQEIRNIRDAMKTRGAGHSISNFYRSTILPFCVRLVNISDLLALSVETRAFSSNNNYTVWKPVFIGRRDILYGILVIIIFIGAIILLPGGRSCMKAIEFKNVYFRYGAESPTILRNISFSWDYGKVILLMGYSGCGKSTLMSLLNGTIPNYVSGELAGEILINGESVKGKSISQLSSVVGSVLQNADNQIVHDIVEDEIAFGPENMGIEASLIDSAIAQYTSELQLDRNAQTRKLSGGQKQRLITASTLAMKQKIILLDEPLANLDQKGAALVLKRLQMLAHMEKYLVLIVEHRIDYLMDYIDEIYRIEEASLKKLSAEELKKQEGNQLPYPGNFAKENVILRADNISMRFGQHKILDQFSMELKEGEKILLLGENGCGKTTLTKILARLLKPSEGYVISPYGNKAAKSWFRQVGYVYQNPDYQLFLPTVQREIDFACASETLKQFVIQKLELEPLLDRHPFSLSEGQKRKLTVAAIVCMKPKILFLDEPTVGQDDKSLANLIEVLLHLNQNYGTALVSVTHDKRCDALGDRKIYLCQN